jgi:hypothetical protein
MNVATHALVLHRYHTLELYLALLLVATSFSIIGSFVLRG